VNVTGVRVPLFAPPAVLDVEAAGIARVSLAWWDDAGPVLVDRGAGPCTVVAVWPTDRRGYIDAPAVRRGEVLVMRWDPSAVHLQRLRAVIAAGWDLRRHDLFIHPGGLGPARESLLAALGLDVSSLVEAAIRALPSASPAPKAAPAQPDAVRHTITPAAAALLASGDPAAVRAVERRAGRETGGFVYFIVCGKLGKIGTTIDLAGRAKSYLSHGAEVEVVAVTWYGGRRLEQEAHRTLAPWRVRTEWFPAERVRELARQWAEAHPHAFDETLREEMQRWGTP
jgi:hypothetical protein